MARSNGIRQYILLAVHCDYITILYRFGDISNCNAACARDLQ